ncbi:MAG: 5-formyltetrahydrofolate cyclo-ligase [Thomasclavelia sp.]|nr:5-formyltetrahydrofolate cyclo-ligase [Thomasclavelia sp.]
MIALDKKEIRKKLLKKRNNLSITEALDKSSVIINNLKSLKEYQTANTIAIYVSYNNEVDTIEFIKENISIKRICVPKIINKEMNFYLINSFDELKPGYFNILEPITNHLISKNEIDLMIIPVVGYDKNFNRLGYGGGFYDRYLKGYKGSKIGIAYSFQRVEKIDTEKFDVPLDKVISENKDCLI